MHTIPTLYVNYYTTLKHLIHVCTCGRADANGNLPKKCTSPCRIVLSVELEGLLLVVCFTASNRSHKQVIRQRVIISKDQGSCSCRTPFSVLRCLRKKMFFSVQLFRSHLRFGEIWMASGSSCISLFSMFFFPTNCCGHGNKNVCNELWWRAKQGETYRKRLRVLIRLSREAEATD